MGQETQGRGCEIKEEMFSFQRYSKNLSKSREKFLQKSTIVADHAQLHLRFRLGRGDKMFVESARK